MFNTPGINGVNCAVSRGGGWRANRRRGMGCYAGAQAGADLSQDADDLVGQKGFSFLEGRANSIRQSLSSLIAFFK